MKLVDLIPHMARSNVRGPDGVYLYRNEVDLAVAMAAIAEQHGLSARTQVPTALGGFADLVVALPDGLGDMVIELKIALKTPAQFRRAAEQALGYQRHLGAAHVGILAPTVNRHAVEDFKRHYPEVMCFTTTTFVPFITRWSDDAAIAQRVAMLLGAAERLIGSLTRTEKSVEALYGVRSARRVLVAGFDPDENRVAA